MASWGTIENNVYRIELDKLEEWHNARHEHRNNDLEKELQDTMPEKIILPAHKSDNRASEFIKDALAPILVILSPKYHYTVVMGEYYYGRLRSQIPPSAMKIMGTPKDGVYAEYINKS